MAIRSQLLLPAALAGAAIAFTAAAGPGASKDPGRIELEVAGFLPVHEGVASILVLREKGGRTLLPVIIPGADSGARELRASNLLGQTIEALGGRVAEVEIDRAEESRAGARVRLAQGSRRLEIRARPSESVALAQAAGVPIVTTRRVLDEAGLTPEDLARTHAKSKARESRL